MSLRSSLPLTQTQMDQSHQSSTGGGGRAQHRAVCVGIFGVRSQVCCQVFSHCSPLTWHARSYSYEEDEEVDKEKREKVTLSSQCMPCIAIPWASLSKRGKGRGSGQGCSSCSSGCRRGAGDACKLLSVHQDLCAGAVFRLIGRSHTTLSPISREEARLKAEAARKAEDCFMLKLCLL